MRGVTVLYDQATEGTMGGVALAVANAFVGFPDPNVPPPAGLRRRVGYGSAIVVASDGTLVTPRRVTSTAAKRSPCRRSVTPSGSPRDKPTGSRSFVFYGARNLAPALFAETPSLPGDVTLIGFADPLAQTGDAVARRCRRASPQLAIEPAPKLGFSGAAAADGRRAVACMVDLRPAVVAGAAQARGRRDMVPVGRSPRLFLQAHRSRPPPRRARSISRSCA